MTPAESRPRPRKVKPAAPDRPHWLSQPEMAAWLPLVRLLSVLPNALDTQLRNEAGISHVYYQILAILSAAPARQLRMSELARASGTSTSRLSHAVTSLESRGWVRRTPSADDRRGQLAELTPAGQQTLTEAAPGHLAQVRRLVFDHLTGPQVDQLQHLTSTLLAGLTGSPGQRPQS